MSSFRVIALVAAHNEARFIGGCIEHLHTHGVETYVIDNDSDDGTADIARNFLGRGVVCVETFPRQGEHRWKALLERKEQLATVLEADWFMHVDPDEIRLPPPGVARLADALRAAEDAGYNAVNFQEFTFVPTREHPDHDHPRFRETMRWYYPFRPWFPHQLKAWRRQPERVDLASSGGHNVTFPGLHMHPVSFPMKHYIFLSPSHATEKYARRRPGSEERALGWGGWRIDVADRPLVELVPLPSRERLRKYVSDETLDATDPETAHFWAEEWAHRTRALT